MKRQFKGILTLFFALVVQLIFAQEKTIKGTVSDKSGELPGVSIVIKGTTTGTETDLEGKYSIKVKLGDTLIFSYVGYETVERIIDTSNVVNVLMKESGNVLDEIVITGYTTTKKADFTGSAVQLNEQKINDLANATVDQALQGKVPGLTITQNSGTPGSTSNIRIRGISSINAGNEPLYVIDGVPITNGNVSTSSASSSFSSLAGLNTNNIKSITVLKDAAATSQYGARGANGVIVITTKTGRSGKTKFQYNYYYGIQNDATTGPIPLNGVQRLELHTDGLFNDNPGVFANKEAARDWLLANDAATIAWDAAGRPEANWSNVVANKNAPIIEHNISASGGSDNHTFFGSLSYFKQEGTVIGSEFERVSASINITNKFSNRIRLSSNNSASYSYQDAFLERSAYFEGARTVKYFLSPFVQPYNSDGTPAEYSGSLPNPIIIARDNINDNRFVRIISNNALDWQPIDNLSYEFRFGADYQIFNSRSYQNRNYGYGAPTDGYASQSIRNNVTYTFQNKINYSYKLNQDHKFNANLIQEYQANRSYFLTANGDSFADDGLVNLDSSGNITGAGSSFFDWRIARYLGLFSYNAFDSRYVADFSYTYEGSSRFAPKNRWGRFWAVGTAWNINKEKFLKNSSFINNLKLRISYGTTGNGNIGGFEYETLFSFGVDYNSQGAQLLGGLGNKKLSWEKSTTLDLGLDFGFFENKLSGNIAYFNRKTSDLLFNVPLPPSTGFQSIRENFGEVSNKGIEASFSLEIPISESFNASIGGNFATVKNNVEKLPVDPNGVERVITNTTTRIESGHPIRGWYMPTWAGVNPQTGLEEWYVDGISGTTTTDFNSADAVWQGGNSVPTFTAGVNIHLNYKGLFLDANGFYAGGHKVYENWHLYLNQPNGYSTRFFNGYTTLLDRWQQPGDISRNPKVRRGTQPWQRHSKFLHDGDFFRLRTVTIGYDLPHDLLENININSLRVFIRGNNMFTWQKAKNNPYDPEVDLGGGTGLETPPIKTLMLGLTLKI